MKVVIFCGGFGTRMWPASRKSFPKQFFPLINGKSFFQTTYFRFRKIFKTEDIIVSTEARYVRLVRKQIPQIPKQNIIAEPERRDNLAAIGLVTAIIEKRYPGEVMLASWSDHFIGKEETFLSAFYSAGKYAKETGLIVSVNEEPRSPSIQNEWIKTGEVIDEVDGRPIIKILETIKRPELEQAKKMFQSRGYLINTGYRAWRTDVMLGYYKKLQPKMYESLMKIAESYGKRFWETTLYREYHKLDKNSVEFGIFVNLPKEKSVTIAADFGWEDAGTWELFYKARRVNANENVVEGELETEILESSGNLIIGTGNKIVSLIGVSGLAIIDTPDALLVTNLSDSGKVKEVFTNLEKNKKKFVE